MCESDIRWYNISLCFFCPMSQVFALLWSRQSFTKQFYPNYLLPTLPSVKLFLLLKTNRLEGHSIVFFLIDIIAKIYTLSSRMHLSDNNLVMDLVVNFVVKNRFAKYSRSRRIDKTAPRECSVRCRMCGWCTDAGNVLWKGIKMSLIPILAIK